MQSQANTGQNKNKLLKYFTNLEAIEESNADNTKSGANVSASNIQRELASFEKGFKDKK